MDLSNSTRKERVGGGLAALVIVGLGLWGALHVKSVQEETKKKAGIVHSYVAENGPLEFQYGEAKVKAFADKGLGFEFYKDPPEKSEIHDVVTELGKNAIRNQLNLENRGDGNEIGEDCKLLPRYSSCIIDRGLDGIDREDLLREWKYNPRLLGAKKGDSYIDRIKWASGVAKDILDTAWGVEPKAPEEREIVIDRILIEEKPLGNLAPGLEGKYEDFVRSAYNAIISSD